MKNSFAQRLEHLRGSRTQKEFAKLLEVPLTSYTNWVLRMRSPSIDYLNSICTKLGVSADYLLGLTDDPHPRHSPGSIHINGKSNSVINGHGINATVTSGDNTEAKTVLQRLDALEAAVKMLSTRTS